MFLVALRWGVGAPAVGHNLGFATCLPERVFDGSPSRGALRDPMGNGVGAAVFQAAVPDFAERSGDVAVVFEVLREGDDIGQDAAEVVFEIVNFGGVGTAAEEQGSARGAADGLLAIGAREAEGSRGEPVNIGRDGEGVAVAADGGFQVVDGDEEDVEFAAGLLGE